MFEVGLFLDDIDQDLDRALDVAADLGVRAVEIRSAWGRNLIDHPDERVTAIFEAIRARGLRVPCIAAPLLKSRLDGQGRVSQELFFAQPRDAMTDQIAILHRAAAMARCCGTRLVRCFSFWRVDQPLDRVWAALLSPCREIVRVAEAEGVTLALENDFECNLGSGELAARLVAEIGSPHLRSLWDPGNAFFAGENPFPTGYRHVRGTIAHVHVKDAVRDPSSGQPRWVALGTGEVDLLGQLLALRADGYAGVVTMENHYTPAGGSKEDGVRESFRGLRRLMDAVSQPHE